MVFYIFRWFRRPCWFFFLSFSINPFWLWRLVIIGTFISTKIELSKVLLYYFFLLNLFTESECVTILHDYLLTTISSTRTCLFIIFNWSHTILLWWHFTWIYFLYLIVVCKPLVVLSSTVSILWMLFTILWFDVFIWSLYNNTYLLSSFSSLSNETWNLIDNFCSSSSKRVTYNSSLSLLFIWIRGDIFIIADSKIFYLSSNSFKTSPSTSNYINLTFYFFLEKFIFFFIIK
jgi:hypothetical protein